MAIKGIQNPIAVMRRWGLKARGASKNLTVRSTSTVAHKRDHLSVYLLSNGTLSTISPIANDHNMKAFAQVTFNKSMMGFNRCHEIEFVVHVKCDISSDGSQETFAALTSKVSALISAPFLLN